MTFDWSPAEKDSACLTKIGVKKSYLSGNGLLLIVQNTLHRFRVGGRQLANIVFANIGGCTARLSGDAGKKWKPACQLLLIHSADSQKDDLIRKKVPVYKLQKNLRIRRA